MEGPGRDIQGFVARTFTYLEFNLPIPFIVFARLSGAAGLHCLETISMAWFETPSLSSHQSLELAGL